MLPHYRRIGLITLGGWLSLSPPAAALADQAPTQPPAAAANPSTWVLDTAALGDLDGLIKKLTAVQVVHVGEIHDRFEHHLNQLAIIRGLHAKHPDLVIGMEFFQQPFQPYLDQYIAGTLSEGEMLRKTEYFSRWSYDYRLYRPILQFARDRRIPLIALNIPRELTQKVSRQGLAMLTPEERAQIPAEMDRSDALYRQRLEQIFAEHPMKERNSFENFLDAQLLWDEGMADRAAQHFRAHPNGHMVLLAGAGHLVHGQGIPSRLARRVAVRSSVVINDSGGRPEPGVADFLLFPQPVETPKGGTLGVFLEQDDDNNNVIKGFTEGSPAEAAGLRKGDRLVSLGSASIKSYEDIRIALLDQQPGDEVDLEVARSPLFMGEERVRVRVRLF